MLRDRIINNLREALTSKRFEHTLRVEETACSLANYYKVDEELVSTAALLHDCAKDLEPDQMHRLAKDLQLNMNGLEEYPQIIHGFLGAKIAHNRYGLGDNKLLDAIQYHTTGRPNMSTIEKIIYLADYIEPGRVGIAAIDKVRNVVYEDLDKALFMALENTISYLESINKPIHPLTQSSLQFYKQLGGHRDDSR